MLEKFMRYVLQEEAGDGKGGSAAGGGATGGAAAAGGDGAGKGVAAAGDAGAGDANKGAGGEQSLLEQIGKGGAAGDDGKGGGKAVDDGGNLTPEQRALQIAEKDTRRPKEVPAKYWDAEKGEVNYAAWAKSTTELETRMRTYGLPPKTADEYKFDVPKELKEHGVDLDPALTKTFRDEAYTMGLTQKQYEGVMGAYFKHIANLANQVSQFSQEKARTELLGYYKTEEAMTENVRNAFRVFSSFADEKDMEGINQIGNIPAVIRVLAKIWPEMREDPNVNPDTILEGESLENLMRGGPGKDDSPYWNKTDPRHKVTVAKVQAHHERQASARRRKAG